MNAPAEKNALSLSLRTAGDGTCFGDQPVTGFTPELVARVSAAIQSKHYHRDRAVAALEASRIAEFTEAARAVLERMSSTYKTRNGREVGIEGADGEKCWIVHSDDIAALERALAKIGGAP